MPPIETQNLNQKAVLWMSSGKDDYGKFTVISPVEISCRWEEKRRQSMASDNTVIAIDSTVYVDRVIKQGSILWKGTMKEWTKLLTTTDSRWLKEVTSYNEIPDIKGRKIQRTVTLAQYNQQLPTVV